MGNLISLVCVFVIVVLCFVSSNTSFQKAPLRYVEDMKNTTNTENTKNTKIEDTKIEDTENESTKQSIKYCDCKLVTWHPGLIEHRMVCPVFRERNPNLSVKQFMKTEGFEIKEEKEWPPIDPNVIPEKNK